MSWRIKGIILYQRDGAGRRALDFNLHGVNVITGDSQTGKSAVLDILNYILMSQSCPIPKGIIRQAVSHVGGHFVGPDGSLLVLRPLPAAGRKVSTQSWYQLGHDLVFPEEVPEMSSNRDVARDILSSFTGITGASILSDLKEPWEEVQADANIRHAAPLIFQPQDVIANRYISVPGLDSENRRRHMLDALPFLLGIENAEILTSRARLRELKSKFRMLKVKGKESAQLRANTFSRGHKLWLDAQGIGLIEGQVPESVPALLSTLRNVGLLERQRFDIATVVPNMGQLEEDEISKRKAVQEKRKSIQVLKDFKKSVAVHQDVVSRQLNTLSVSELLPSQTHEGNCPLCDSDSFDPLQYHERLKVTLSSLEGMRAEPLRIDVKTRKALKRQEEELVPLVEQHTLARTKLRSGAVTISKNQGYLSSNRKIDHLLGRISEYIRTVDVVEVDDEEDLDVLAKEIETLQRKINSVWRRKKDTQEAVDTEMTELARSMEVEFQNGKATISVEDLSMKVQVDPDSDEMTSLAEIGSGSNWVCYHLAGILAIHSHLSEAECPVPRTLLLDQPSQAWFPEELRVTDSKSDLIPEGDEDTNRVRDIYKLLKTITSKGNFSQIIVMDHAKFNDPWFKDIIRYEWRFGEKLVPEGWVSGAGLKKVD